MGAKCGNCKFREGGRCHRYPPQIVPLDKDVVRGFLLEAQWPVVDDHQWCGEYSPDAKAVQAVIDKVGYGV